MLLLFETPAGFALFKVKKEKKFKKVDDFAPYMETSKLKKLVELKAFRAFKDTKDVLRTTVKLLNGKMSKALKKFLKKNILKEELSDKLAVADKKTAKLIKEHLEIETVRSDRIDELMRCIRFNVTSLIEGLSETTLREMSLGLAHGLGRYKLKFSADKVDTMVIQAVSLYQDLDKEINNYMMRLREWYGYHFPELGNIVTDNMIYAKVVRMIGIRTKTAEVDLSEEVPDDVESEIKEAAEISMGTEINERDEKFILCLADQILDLDVYRSSLGKYLESRMMAVAPNLSAVVGDTIAAKLIARAGSLMALAKYPASTLQILGAEKALFKAMKTRKNTPKYGIIYQTKLVSQAQGRAKGKISRTMSAKCALCVRYDALGESQEAQIGADCKKYLDERLAYLTAQEAKGGRGFGRNQRGQGQGGRSSGGYNSGGDYLGKRNFSGSGYQDGAKKRFKTQ